MPNSTRKVQKEKVRQSSGKNRDPKRLLAFLASSDRPYIARAETLSKRPYPFRYQGECLALWLNHESRTTQRTLLLTSVRVLQEMVRAKKNRDVTAIDRLRKRRKGLNFAYEYLLSVVAAGAKRTERFKGVHEEGLIFAPSTGDGEAALAALILEKENKIDQIKQCLHCKQWFYALFKHQRFCNDFEKKCQWNHYHTPEWRKKHREQNRKHQKEYRKRLFDVM